ncbi:MAG TPA: hypothetical protein PLT35_11545 [Vicinamibacterales bacterium]|nr:hypothetical protein [Vicinamibacterales bacterium]HOQ61181.1 hypothetical protein [Vicinamibacterales bacterium]
MTTRAARCGIGLAACLAAALGHAAAQGMDARQMSGIPIPSPDVAPGTVSVRLVRGTMADNIAGHEVQLIVGAGTRSARTDAAGRALFEGVEAGVQVRAVALVGEERLESSAFGMPASAGVRLVLVAGGGAASAGAEPPPGSAPSAVGTPPTADPAPMAGGSGARASGLSFGSGSRIHIELEDDVLEVFYLFELVNAGTAPVSPSPELSFTLPDGAEQAAPIEDTQQVTIRGRRVTINNPIKPGRTPVKLAYAVRPGAGAHVVAQRFPLDWDGLRVVLAGAGAARMTSPQFTSSRQGEDGGSVFVAGSGGALAAGQELAISLDGLPHRSRTGRNVALALGLVILAAGAYSAFSAGPVSGGDAGRRAQLAERRERLLADLVRVEEARRAGSISESRHAARREDLVRQLERIYGELDAQESRTAAAAG